MNELQVVQVESFDVSLLAPNEAEVQRWLDSPNKLRVYFIECVGHSLVKIGVSDAPRRRVDDLQTGSPFELRLIHAIPGDMKLERLLHYAFRGQHFRGEWFGLAGPVQAFIAATTQLAEIEATGVRVDEFKAFWARVLTYPKDVVDEMRSCIKERLSVA